MHNIPQHLAAVVRKSIAAPTEVRKPIHRAFLGKNALPTEQERNVVSADFNESNQLVINFDTGESITTKSVVSAEFIEENIAVSPTKFVDFLQFDTTANVEPVIPGLMTWNDEYGTLDLGLGIGDAMQQIGFETYALVSNSAATPILNGQPVSFAGAGVGSAIGGLPMIANGTINPLRIIGISTQDIPVGQIGYVTTFGAVNGLNTTGASVGETWLVGDILYVHPTIVGGLTKVRPIPPQVTAVVGAVTIVGTTDGRIVVSPRAIPQLVYGSFYSDTQQDILVANTAQSVTFNNTVETAGVSLATDTFTVATPALYIMDFAFGFKHSNSNNKKFWVWLRRQNVDVPNSALTFTISGNSTEVNISGNFSVKLNAGENVKLMVACDSNAGFLDVDPATAFAPASPSAKLTIFQLNS